MLNNRSVFINSSINNKTIGVIRSRLVKKRRWNNRHKKQDSKRPGALGSNRKA